MIYGFLAIVFLILYACAIIYEADDAVRIVYAIFLTWSLSMVELHAIGTKILEKLNGDKKDKEGK